jgi:predicted transcriptional regulator
MALAASGTLRRSHRRAEGLELTRQAVTKHLRVLEKGGLVTS